MKQNDMDIAHVPQVIATCCILHNICEIHGDTFVDTWLDSSELLQPTLLPHQ